MKKLNPGWDLLLHADWDEQLRAMGFPKSDDSTTAKPGNRNSSLKPETISISGSDPSVIATTTRSEAVALGGGALLLLVAGGLAWRNLQTSP